MPDDDTEPMDPEQDPVHIKALRKKAADFDTMAAERARVERELAFTKAGYDTDRPLVANLMKGYEGELSREAVAAYMDSLEVGTVLTPSGIPNPAPPAPEAAVHSVPHPPNGTQALDRLATVDGGIPVAEAPKAHPAMIGLDKAFDALEQGGSRANAASIYFSEIFGAAVEGDQRVILDGNLGSRLPEPRLS